VIDDPEIQEFSRSGPRHRMRRSLFAPNGTGRSLRRSARNARRTLAEWSFQRWGLVGALVASLVVAGVGVAALPGRWHSAFAKAAPSPGGSAVVEAKVGNLKEVVQLPGVIVREPDQPIRATANGTLTSVGVKQDDEVRAGTTLGVITPLPTPAPPLPSPSPLPSSSPTPTASPSPSPPPPLPPIQPVSVVTAPVDGVITEVDVVLGQHTRPGKTMFVLAPDQFDVIAPVGPSLLPKFFTSPLEIKGTIDEGPPPFECPFVSIGDNLETSGAQTILTQDSDFRCSVPVSVTVFPGIHVRLAVTTAEADGAVILPRDVIQIQGQEGTVWVVEKGRAPAKRTVRLGISQGSMIQVISGLKAGERVLDLSRTPPPST